MTENTENVGAGLTDHGTEEAAKNATALATIAAALTEHGLAPEGDYEIAEVATDVIGRFKALTAERDDLIQKLDKAASAAQTSRGKAPAKARKIAPVDDQPKAQDLLELIGAAKTVEVAFSNGKTEMADLAPLVITGDAWAISLDRVKLNVPDLLVHGPGGGEPAYSVAGYGLLLDGKLVAYSARSDALLIGANSQVNLKDDIIF